MEPASDADLEAIFEHIDHDRSGSLSVDELRAALTRKGLTEAETEQIFGQLDQNKDGQLSKHEFLSKVNHIGNKTRTIFAWYLAFEKYDKNGDGALSKEEFAAVLRDHGVTLEHDQLAHFYQRADTDGDQRVDYAEFIRWKTGKSLSTMKDDKL